MGAKGYQGEPSQVALHPERLGEPLKWKKPQKVFVCSMGDLFHSDVPWQFICEAFEVMASTPHITYQVLTKRPGRMMFFAKHVWTHWSATSKLTGIPLLYPKNHDEWPPNVWAGTSVESEHDGKRRLTARLDLLAQVPAKVRFVSVEPMLGPVDLSLWLVCPACKGQGTRPGYTDDVYEGQETCHTCDRGNFDYHDWQKPTSGRFLDWVIVGGESGPGARPMNPEWVRNIKEQCEYAEVPFFFKQWGEHRPETHWILNKGAVCVSTLPLNKVGVKAAGALLDGREYREMP